MSRTPHHVFLLSVGKKPNGWPHARTRYEIVLLPKGKYYIYSERNQSLKDLINHIDNLPDDNDILKYDLYWLSKLLTKKETQKEVKRCIKLGYLKEEESGMVSRQEKNLKGSTVKWVRKKEGISLKKDSKIKTLRRLVDKEKKRSEFWQKRFDGERMFDGISNNVFGHPQLKKNNLKAKKQKKGYRRAHQKQGLLIHE